MKAFPALLCVAALALGGCMTYGNDEGVRYLQRKPAPGRSSFWLPKRMPADIRSYFRQY